VAVLAAGWAPAGVPLLHPSAELAALPDGRRDGG
jgi:hypothetical protein